MKDRIIGIIGTIALGCAFAGASFAQTPTILSIDIDNLVAYAYDSPDITKFGTVPDPMPLAGGPAFTQLLYLGDVVAINERPAKGAYVGRLTVLTLRTAPTPGQAIADVNRSGVCENIWELKQADGSPLGTIMCFGTGSGDPVPGEPLSVPAGNIAIVGGSGAFTGARGLQSFPPGGAVRAIRFTSVLEDPSRRVEKGGGGLFRITFTLYPMTRPEIASIFHADFSAVSAASPARAGETLIVRASGLGATRPGVDPGKPFPVDTLQGVNSPVDVTINGRTAEVLNKVGWPGAVDVFRVDFRMPDGIASGMATIQLSAAWIPGAGAQIAVK